jgi:hypothetical protein
MKICGQCQKEKDDTEFYVDRTRNRLQSMCKTCSSINRKNWLSKNKEKERTRAMSYYENNKEQAKISARKYHLKNTYNLSVDQYENMILRQENLCAICKGPPTGRYNKLVVDHCHKTNKVRGLLCHECNYLLGLAKDNTDVLKAAIQYLESK